MSRMTDGNINNHIKHGIRDLCPEKAEEIWNQPAPRAKGDEWYLSGAKTSASLRKKIIWMVPSVAACFLLCFIVLHAFYLRTDARIYLDVNPSVELEINRKEKVLAAEANNADGLTVLEGMDLENTDLDVAINAILGSMVKHGYLNEAKNMILLSVDSKDQEKAEILRKALSEDIDACLKALIGSGVIFNQDVETDEEIKKLAEKYQISPGKAALLQKITKEHPEIKYEELARLPMSKLPAYLGSHGIHLEDYTEQFVEEPDDDKDDIDDDDKDDVDDDKDDIDDDKDDDKDDIDDDKDDIDDDPDDDDKDNDKDDDDKDDDKDDIDDDKDDDKDDIDDDKDDDKDDIDDDKDDKDDIDDDKDDDKDDIDDDKDDDDDDDRDKKPSTGRKPSGTVSKPSKPSGTVSKPAKPSGTVSKPSKPSAPSAGTTKPQAPAKPQVQKPQQPKPQVPKPQQPEFDDDDDDDDYEEPEYDDDDDEEEEDD